MAFNFTDDLGFIETDTDNADTGSGRLNIVTVIEGPIGQVTDVRFTDLGVYARTVANNSIYGDAVTFIPWTQIKHIGQNQPETL